VAEQLSYYRCNDRSELGELLLRKGPTRWLSELSSFDALAPIRDQELLLIWRDESSTASGFPETVVIGDGQLQETIAWFTTYLTEVRPFSAQFRLFELGALREDIDRWRREPPHGFHHVFASVIIAEAVESAHLGGVPGSEQISVSACQSTLSWALLRDLVVRERRHPDVAGNWQRARLLTRQRERHTPTSEVQTAVSVVATLIGDRHLGEPEDRLHRRILEACEELRHSGELRSTLGGLSSDLQPLVTGVRGTRERRVQAVDDLFEAILRDRRPASTVDAFLVAYAVSQIKPGSLMHASVLAPVLRSYPGILTWLGLCSGLHPESNVAAELDGLGWRAVRDLLARERPIERPRADISLPELLAFLGGETRDTDFITGLASKLWVELVPGVTTLVNWQGRVRTEPGDESMRTASLRAAQDGWDELGRLLTRAREVYRELSPHHGRATQLDMFGKHEKRSRKR